MFFRSIRLDLLEDMMKQQRNNKKLKETKIRIERTEIVKDERFLLAQGYNHCFLILMITKLM